MIIYYGNDVDYVLVGDDDDDDGCFIYIS